jgi:hypothetical protein
LLQEAFLVNSGKRNPRNVRDKFPRVLQAISSLYSRTGIAGLVTCSLNPLAIDIRRPQNAWRRIAPYHADLRKVSLGNTSILEDAGFFNRVIIEERGLTRCAPDRIISRYENRKVD